MPWPWNIKKEQIEKMWNVKVILGEVLSTFSAGVGVMLGWFVGILATEGLACFLNSLLKLEGELPYSWIIIIGLSVCSVAIGISIYLAFSRWPLRNWLSQSLWEQFYRAVLIALCLGAAFGAVAIVYMERLFWATSG